MSHMLERIGNGLILLCTLETAVFIAGYLVLARPLSTPAGRRIMAFSTGILGLLALASLTVWLGRDWPAREIIRVGAWAYLALALGYCVSSLVRVQSHPTQRGKG